MIAADRLHEKELSAAFFSFCVKSENLDAFCETEVWKNHRTFAP